MSLIVVRIATASLALVALAAQLAFGHEARSCASTGSRVLASSGETRVYRVHDRQIYACRPDRRRLPLGFARGSDGDVVLRPRAAGKYVAFERAYQDELDRQNNVVVVNVESGRTVTSAPTGRLLNPDGPDSGIGPTTALVLRSDGAVAWIARDIDSPSAETLEVWVDKARKRKQLATGTTIRADVLKLSSSSVTWTQGGKLRRAASPKWRRRAAASRPSGSPAVRAMCDLSAGDPVESDDTRSR